MAVDPRDNNEIADHIQSVTSALDDRRWDEWLAGFTPQAVLDFSAAGIEPTDPAGMRQTLSAHDASRIASQHLLGRVVVDEIDDGSARAKTEYRMVALARLENGRARRTEVAGWYEDELVRAGEAWRISTRRVLMRWRRNEELEWTD